MSTTMIKSFAIAVSAVLLAFGADVKFDYQEGEKSEAIVSPEMQQAAAAMLGNGGDALLHAMRLQMAKYDNDMRTRAGRAAWHGKLVSVEHYTNELFAVETWSNEVTGAVWKYRLSYKPPTPKTVQRNIQFTTNGIPRRLAEARARRARELNAGTVVTNIVIEAGK